MSSESQPPESTPSEAPKPAFKIASKPSDAPKPAGVTRPPVSPRPAAAAGTSVPFKVNVPVEEKKGVSPLMVVIDLLAAAAAITFAVLLYQIHAGPTFP